MLYVLLRAAGMVQCRSVNRSLSGMGELTDVQLQNHHRAVHLHSVCLLPSI